MVHYKNDGWGRDSYIRGNHGGLMHKANYKVISLPQDSKYKIHKRARSSIHDDEGAFSCQKLIPNDNLYKENLPFHKTTIL